MVVSAAASVPMSHSLLAAGDSGTECAASIEKSVLRKSVATITDWRRVDS